MIDHVTTHGAGPTEHCDAGFERDTADRVKITTIVMAEGEWTMEIPNEMARYGQTFGTAMGEGETRVGGRADRVEVVHRRHVDGVEQRVLEAGGTGVGSAYAVPPRWSSATGRRLAVRTVSAGAWPCSPILPRPIARQLPARISPVNTIPNVANSTPDSPTFTRYSNVKPL